MHLRKQWLTHVLLASCLGTSASAAPRSNFDAFLARPGSTPLAVADEQAHARGLRVEHTETRLGVPSVLWSMQSGPGLQTAARAGTRPEDAARAYLGQVADLYRLKREDVSAAPLQSVHQTGKGAVIVTFRQAVEGVEVFRSEVKVVMTQALSPVAVTGYLAPSELTLAARQRTGANAFQRSAADAVAAAYSDQSGTPLGPHAFIAVDSRGGYTLFDFEPGVRTVMPGQLVVPARAKKVFFTLPDGLRPAWYVEVNAGPKSSKDSDYTSYVISAVDGAVLFRNDLRAHAAEQTYRYTVWAETAAPYRPFDGPQGSAGSPFPRQELDGYDAPLDVPPNVVELQNSPFSRNDPWLPANATQTVGNNVDAYVDLVAPDGYQPGADLRADITGERAFDYVYDPHRAPGSSIEQMKASVVNLFFINNFLHDWYYDAGFDEASGNAQMQNFGRGGIEGDPLRVEGQDYNGRNNANMATPADGISPRMQMYVFDGMPLLQVTAPASLARAYVNGDSRFGAQEYTLDGPVQVLAPTGRTLGCTPFEAGTFAGHVALLDRGACDFVTKALNAQDAGAIAVLVANTNAGEGPLSMSGDDARVTVPVASISRETADLWKAEVAANASTVQVRLHRSKDLDRDGTLDNTIIAHEWGHYISNRLIGNASGLTNNQGRSMGEGWADVHALLMVVREGDDYARGAYAVGGYVSGGGGGDGYYYGVRRAPYATAPTLASSRNALTFRHIENGNPLPTSHPLAYGQAGLGNSAVHSSGEVWASMLWECYVSLLQAHPFQEAQDRMKHYLVAGYKATPVSPTFLEARDALLAVTAASDPADYQRFLQAFAKRGAGMGAKAPDRDSMDHVGVVESFAAGNFIEVTSLRLDDALEGCDKDGVLDVGETGLLRVSVRNVGSGSLGAFSGTVSTTSSTATLEFPSGNTLTFSSMGRGGTATATLPVRLAAAQPNAHAGLRITFDEPSLPASASSTTFDPRVNYDEVPGAAAEDDFEGALSSWTSSTWLNPYGEADWKVQGPEGGRYMHAPNPAVQADLFLISPWMKVNETGAFSFSFRYRHSFESDIYPGGSIFPYYDGAVLEFTHDGLQWYDIAAMGVASIYSIDPTDGSPGYIEQGPNPLMYRNAWVGQNVTQENGKTVRFPEWSTAELRLADMFAGKNVQFRFRIGTDTAVGAYGFDLDDVRFTNVERMPFSGRVDEQGDGATCNQRPVANAGRDVGSPSAPVYERVRNPETGALELVRHTLDGTASYDPEGQPLTYHWTQVSGPAVTLVNADTATPSFTADVPDDSILTFQLVVRDGLETSAAHQVRAWVLNVNRAPTAVVTAPAEVAEFSSEPVTLDARASSDPDGELISYKWAQTSGPAVALKAGSSATPSFKVPEVAADTQLTFTLVVNDGRAQSKTATVTVMVRNVDRAPVADAGSEQVVDPLATASLSATAVDPDGDALTWTWRQVEGPAVELQGADTATPSFTAPEVRAETVLRFEAIASANGLSSAPMTATVTVRHANKAPQALPRLVGDARSGAQVTLDASASSDPDGDALTFGWKQVAGPSVTLSASEGAQVTFRAPEVKQAVTLHFELTATDARGGASTAVLGVTVQPSSSGSSGGCSSTGGSSPGLLLSLFGLLVGAVRTRRRA
ncbi:peptidase, M36 (fungalysin) family [Myxococcus xanthus DK 1622]|uniref:Peptidase, M36 (Fungalysin) family n=1 Tax=Myxococcus xanthus (strain DK1622) TaxID=246197 RepID=Q1D176_MYXXD|nr:MULTISPECIES: myxosortase-dependent M36 family metallopeptidase [Myxococcus]ABF87161.1 peptidase, M36 (fungalysin) family [Myxococcus xanthus DK 1622]NOJ55510.1 histidine kinase [Myxococcus xanthus]QPM77901.1 myxosortase-dependent M36 family metallopeptidase [Myxococcus xanthus]QVW66968.1 myxosortase-dependent M36 family metallopeptidase [Myxococcus xanthus DZ2]QZZ53100.1 hypothetical protein MyxoNM_28195 [Myxococcus xanthus]